MSQKSFLRPAVNARIWPVLNLAFKSRNSIWVFLNSTYASIPQEFREIPYLKKFKCKKQDRVFPPDAATVNSVPPPSASAPLTETVSAPRGEQLAGCGSVDGVQGGV